MRWLHTVNMVCLHLIWLVVYFQNSLVMPCHALIDMPWGYDMLCYCHVRSKFDMPCCCHASGCHEVSLIYVFGWYHAMLSFCYEIGCCIRLVPSLSSNWLDAMYLVVLQLHSMYWPGVSCQFCRLFTCSVVLGRNHASPMSCGPQPEWYAAKTSAAI